jgi:uncharacterized protein YjbJ (UPF0337 family)
MTMNENTLKGKWLEIKGDIQKAWGNLADDELEKTKGDMKSIQGLIQQKYGKTQESYEKKLSDIFGRFESKKNETIRDVKLNLKK